MKRDVIIIAPLHEGAGRSYNLLRSVFDMETSREMIVGILRAHADKIEARKVHADGTVIAGQDDDEVIE